MMHDRKGTICAGMDENRTALRRFKEFSDFLRSTHLPGTDSPALLRKVYVLAKRRIELQEQSRLAKELSKGKFRQRIRACRKALRAVRKADDQILQAHKISASGFGVPLYEWHRWFEPVRSSIKTLMSNLRQLEDGAMAQVHPRYRRKGEKPLYEALFGEYDYGLSRLGWKPSQMWFLAELIKVLEADFKKRRTEPPPIRAVLRSLIGKVMEAAFNEHLCDEAIKSAIYRMSRTNNVPLSPRSKRNTFQQKI
jgi:hypothetical protein